MAQLPRPSIAEVFAGLTRRVGDRDLTSTEIQLLANFLPDETELQAVSGFCKSGASPALLTEVRGA